MSTHIFTLHARTYTRAQTHRHRHRYRHAPIRAHKTQATKKREASFEDLSEQRNLIDLLRSSQQEGAVRYICHDTWAKDRKRRTTHRESAGGRGAVRSSGAVRSKGSHKKKKHRKCSTEEDAVEALQKSTKKTRDKMEKIEEKREEKREENRTDDAKREKV